MAPSCVTSALSHPSCYLDLWCKRCDGNLLASQVTSTQQYPDHVASSTTSRAHKPLHPENADSVSHHQGPSAAWPTWDPEAKIPTLLGQRPSQASPAGRDNPAGSSLCRGCSSHICQSIQTGKLVPGACWGSGAEKCGEARHLTKTGPLRVEIKPGAQGTESVVECCSAAKRSISASPVTGLYWL